LGELYNDVSYRKAFYDEYGYDKSSLKDVDNKIRKHGYDILGYDKECKDDVYHYIRMEYYDKFGYDECMLDDEHSMIVNAYRNKYDYPLLYGKSLKQYHGIKTGTISGNIKKMMDGGNISIIASKIEILNEIAIIKDGKELMVESIYFSDDGMILVDFMDERYMVDEVEIIVKDIEKSEISKNQRIINKLREQLEIIRYDSGTFKEYAIEGLSLLAMLEKNISYYEYE
jgi:hypothetical protein